MQETWVWSLGQEDPLKYKMATHSSILAQRIPWTKEPGGLQSMGHKELGMPEWLILSYVYAHVKVIMMCWDKIIYDTVVFC